SHGADAPRSPFQILTYDQAFERFAGTPVLNLLPEELISLAEDQHVSLPDGLNGDRDGLLNVLLAELVEPHLGTAATDGPCFLCDYPASQAALATVRREPNRPAVAERFELYADGIELCNGYQELTDPEELRDRIDAQNRLRVAHGSEPLPIESRLLAAMEHGLPRCSGVALGFDRLLMWLLGAESLAEVVAFPHEYA
ncbi:MAG: amino acid--tRNA ligase-related protein, partial [Planctomycetota bacterium]